MHFLSEKAPQAEFFNKSYVKQALFGVENCIIFRNQLAMKTSKTGLQRQAARYDGIGKIGGG